MGKSELLFQKVSFGYDSLSQPLLRDLSLHFMPGWTGIVGANGSGKTTLLQLATGILKPLSGFISYARHSIYCEQRTDVLPEKARELVLSIDKLANIWKGRLEISQEWLDRWDTLSFGERKRLQIAVALCQEPDVLAIDEPTNHLDSEARQILLLALQAYQGIGLLVSHDREFLDTLCSGCYFVDPPAVVYRPGKVTEGLKQAKLEEEFRQKQHDLHKQEIARIQQTVHRIRHSASVMEGKMSKRHLDKHDSDGRAKIDAIRLSGKDAKGRRRQRQLETRIGQINDTLAAIQIKKTFQTGISQNGQTARRDFLFTLPAGNLHMGEDKLLHYPTLTMKPGDRVALTGANGTGKSTLIRLIMSSLKLPANRVTYVPQEIQLPEINGMLKELHQLSNERLGFVMTIITRLGSYPARLLESETPSPGEVRKILLALGVSTNPSLIIMDEPTNHLDILSIECLETALKDFPAGLLLVSHDQQFLDELTNIHWNIQRNIEYSNSCNLEIN